MLLRAFFPNRMFYDILLDIFLTISVLVAYVSFSMSHLFLPLFALAFIRLYLSVMEYLIFQRPEKFRKASLEQDNWSVSDIFVQDVKIQFYQYTGETSKPAILFLHGWRSSASRMMQRMKYFVDHGWSVLAVDLPNHGSSEAVQKWSAEFSTTCVIEILNATKSDYNDVPFFIYGHSMGGFIGLRLCQRKPEWASNVDLNSIILESPMTQYSLILEETYRILRTPRVLRGVLNRRIFTTVSRLRTISSVFTTIQQADIPHWGMPHVPALILQAEHDVRLGRSHYNAFIEHLEKHSLVYEAHLVSSLTHTGSDDNAERTSILDTYLKERIEPSFFR